MFLASRGPLELGSGDRRRGRARQDRPFLRSGRRRRLRAPHGENCGSQPERDKAAVQRDHAKRVPVHQPSDDEAAESGGWTNGNFDAVQFEVDKGGA